MTQHVFVDESRRGSYLLAATLVAPARLVNVRTIVRRLCLPGERRMHFQSEGNRRRQEIVTELVATQVRTRLYIGHGPSERRRSGSWSTTWSRPVRAG